MSTFPPSPTPSEPAPRFTRRTLLRQTGASLLGVAAGPSLSHAADAAPKSAPAAPKGAGTPPALAPLNRFGRMMQDYLVARVRAIEAEGNARRAKLTTRADAQAYVDDMMKKVRTAFGPLPEKTPLNARTTGRLDRDQYEIENVIFESRPGFLVTASLYLPKPRRGRVPAVVGTCGHNNEGKAAEPYQSFAQGLVRQGYAVLVFDPIGLGERCQYLGADGKPRRGPGVVEHLHAGNPLFLVGENFAAWNAWDAIRAVDYLLTRPEIDPRHLGITGNSGGGTLATWACALDPRFTMAAPSCFVTTLRRNAENELSVDTEQCPPRTLALGLDHADFFAGFAPRPLLTMGQEKDFFDARGLEEAAGRIDQLYTLLGAKGKSACFVGPTVHGYSKENREAMYRWFNQVTGVSTATTEPALTIEEEKSLLCTPAGQAGPQGSRTVFSFTRDRSAALASRRPALSGAALRRAVEQVLNLPPRNGVPDYRILRTLPGNRRYPKRQVGTYVIETEAPAQAVVYRLSDEPLVSRPPRGAIRALLYLAHRSADAELRDDPWLRGLLQAEPGSALYACDVRGLGESQPTVGDREFTHAYGSDYFYASHGVMLDYSYPAQRTHDALRVLDWLQAQGHQEVHLVARGWTSIPGALAALLHPLVTQVSLRQALTSYASIAETEEHAWPLSSYIPRVLDTFDLPDVYRELAAKKLSQVDPCDGATAPA